MAAVQYLGKIVVFGGLSESHGLYEFSEEGELLRDLSLAPHIPGYMIWGTYAIQKRRIFAAGARKVDEKTKFGFEKFDGEKWSLV